MRKPSLSSQKSKLHSNSVTARKILPSIARVRLSRQRIKKAGNCHLYDITEGWEKRVLLQDEMVSKVFTTRELERALRHPEQETILVPRQSGINRPALEQICKRHTLVKTIYFESRKEK